MKQNFHIMQKGYTVCPENWGMVNESALFYRMYYVYGGNAWLCKDNEITPLKKGYLYLFPMMDPYTMWHDPLQPLDVLWFHVEMTVGTFEGFPHLHVKEGSMLWHLLSGMREIVDDVEYADELQQLFSVFLTMLNREIPFKRIESRRMQKVLSYMEEHISESLQVQQLADYVGMDRSYFSRRFKSEFKMSPMQYLTAMKMSVAARELLHGASVYQAAMHVGYTDEKAFSRAFSSYMEMPPGKYKKSHILQP